MPEASPKVRGHTKRQVLEWVFDNMGAIDVDLSKATSEGAIEYWRWARANRAAFYREWTAVFRQEITRDPSEQMTARDEQLESDLNALARRITAVHLAPDEEEILDPEPLDRLPSQGAVPCADDSM